MITVVIKYHKTVVNGYFNEKYGDNSSPFLQVAHAFKPFYSKISGPLYDHIHIRHLKKDKECVNGGSKFYQLKVMQLGNIIDISRLTVPQLTGFWLG